MKTPAKQDSERISRSIMQRSQACLGVIRGLPPNFQAAVVADFAAMFLAQFHEGDARDRAMEALIESVRSLTPVNADLIRANAGTQAQKGDDNADAGIAENE